MRIDAVHAYADGLVFLEDGSFSNITELLGIGVHPGLSDMMRMSGVEEAYISGGASDYDKLEALFRVLPMWSGHPYRTAVQEIITCLTGCEYLLTLESLPEIWTATAQALTQTDIKAQLLQAFGVGRLTCLLTPAQFKDLPQKNLQDDAISMCLHIRSAASENFWGRDVMRQITPQNAQADIVEGIAAYLDTLADKGCQGVAVNLADEAAFVKPNPYTPAQAIARMQKGERLDSAEKSLVVFQTLRLLGGECLRRGWSLMLLYPKADLADALIAYLQTCNSMPALVTVADAPTVAIMQSGKYLCPAELCALEEDRRHQLQILATKMPIGCLGGVYAPLRGAVDLPLWRCVLRGIHHII